jgi:hypothetical protein
MSRYRQRWHHLRRSHSSYQNPNFPSQSYRSLNLPIRNCQTQSCPIRNFQTPSCLSPSRPTLNCQNHQNQSRSYPNRCSRTTATGGGATAKIAAARSAVAASGV